MTQPACELRVFFSTNATASTSFILDDPVQGVLDSATYTLAGDTGTDVTADCVAWSVSRGKSSAIFSEFDAGTARMTLNNETRGYDPFNADGALYGNLVPGKRAKFSVNGVTVFDGKVSDLDASYQTSGRSIVSFDCEDALATLARQTFNEWTATASQTAGPRLTAVLNRSEVGWSGGARNIGTGISTLQADVVSWGTNVLNYCQLVARSDFGAFFASRDGRITFNDRRSNLTDSPIVTFADDGTGVRFQGVGVTVGSETFYTRVSVDRVGGTEQAYSSPTATTDGIRTLSIPGLLLDSDAQALAMATYLAQVYATGDATISEISVLLDDTLISSANMQAILSAELNDVINVLWTPNSIGDPIDTKAVIAGIRHDARPGRHLVTFSLSKYDNRGPFILDSSLLSGTNVLVF